MSGNEKNPTKEQKEQLAAVVTRLEGDAELRQRFMADPAGTLAAMGVDTDTIVTHRDGAKHQKDVETAQYWGCIYVGVLSPSWCRKTSFGTAQNPEY